MSSCSRVYKLASRNRGTGGEGCRFARAAAHPSLLAAAAPICLNTFIFALCAKI